MKPLATTAALISAVLAGLAAGWAASSAVWIAADRAVDANRPLDDLISRTIPLGLDWLPVGAPLMLLGALAVGLPLHWALMQGSRRRLGDYLRPALLVGLLLALVGVVVLGASEPAPEWKLLSGLPPLVAAVAAAWAFWAIRRPDRDPPRTRAAH